MDKIDHTNAKEWMERFLDGATTCAQEKELYEYFHQENLPEEMEQYRAMMAWYETGMTSSATNVSTRKDDRAVGRHKIWQWVSIAASVALIATAGVQYYKLRETRLAEYALYEGSYIVRDGKKITDIATILPELKKADAMIERQEESLTDDATEVDVVMAAALCGTEDARVREIVMDALSDK